MSFVESGVAFAAERFEVTSFTLAVAAFNQRAISVYCRAGFDVVDQYSHETNGGPRRAHLGGQPAINADSAMFTGDSRRRRHRVCPAVDQVVMSWVREATPSLR